ncbi:hypothetical protein [Streptomyces europaeiscabiei]|uniref:hypothetical protein n=1 Tax=Streptomyces europaeiscabiei TaxID=146819 RepID=UPI002E2A8175|nr:hypothetical protein [Streptomyces europaeiscabiei]
MTTDLTHQPAHVQFQALDRRENSSRELLDLRLAQSHRTLLVMAEHLAPLLG